MRHVGEEAGFGSIGFVGGIACGSKFCLALLQFGDVRIGGHDTPFRGFSLANLDPTAITTMLDMRTAGSFMLGDSIRQPGLVASFGIVDQSTFNGGTNDCFESRARLHDIDVRSKKLLVPPIAYDEFVICIVQREAFRN